MADHYEDHLSFYAKIEGMLSIFFALAGVFIVLVIDQFLGRKKFLRAENKRKFIHIFSGVYIAFWPWFLSWRQIQLLSITMLAVVLINRKVEVIDYAIGTKRLTFGDIFFALAVGLCALLTTNKYFFMLAILIMALGDGMAAIIGKRYGGHWKYKAFGQKKTLIGTLTFWFVALLILGFSMPFIANYTNGVSYSLLLILLPPILTLTENYAAFGADNLAIPLITLLALNIA